MALSASSRDLVLLGAGASTVMAGAAIAPVLIPLHEALAGPDDGAWLGRVALILPALIVALTAPVLGLAADRFSRQKMLFASLLAVGIFGALGAVTTNYETFLLSRAALGFATAFSAITATALISDFHQGPGRAQMMSRQTAVNTLGGVVFLIFGGLLGELGWQPPFVLFLLPLIVGYFASRLPTVASTQARRAKTSPPADALLILAAMGAFYLVPTRAPQLFAELGTGTSVTGLVIGLATLSGAAGAMVSQKLSAKFGETGAIRIAASSIAVGLYLFAFAASVGTTLPAAVLLGAGFGIVPPLAANRIMSATQPENRGAAAGWISAALFAGQVSSVALGEPIAALFGDQAPFAFVAFAIVIGLIAQATPREIYAQIYVSVVQGARAAVRESKSNYARVAGMLRTTNAEPASTPVR